MNTFKRKVWILLFLFPGLAQAQNTLEPYIGHSIDVRNIPSLDQVNAGLQYPVINRGIYQMLIRVSAGLPLDKRTGNDIAYTPDPTMPLSAATGYETRWYSGAVSLVHRFRLISWADKNAISLFVKAGFAYHSISVSYDSYNRDKYTVLDPHRSLKKTGPFIGGGIQYKYELTKGSVFAQTELASPALAKNLHNYNYKLPAPFAINIGYAVTFTKKGKK
jgi:hypothetical protein